MFVLLHRVILLMSVILFDKTAVLELPQGG